MEQKLMTPKQVKDNIANEITSGLKQEVSTALSSKNISDSILAKFDELATQGQLYFPQNYSVGNALKLAYSKIVSNGLAKCEPLSIANALSEYVIQGLDVSRNQAYFIDYGGKVTMQRSYFGDVSVIKRTGLVSNINAICVYKGDEFETGFDELGNETVIHHKTKFENRGNEIIGAYAWAEGVNGYRMYCIMTRKEIETSWSMAKAKQSKFREDFKQEASKRTVIRRLVKMIFNTSISTTSEQEALIHSYNRTTEDEFDNSNERKYQTLEGVKEVVEASVCEKKVENPFKETKVEEKVVEETKQEEFVDCDLPFDNDTGEIKDIKTFDYEI